MTAPILGSARERYYLAQVIRPDPHIAVADHYMLVRRLGDQARQLGHFVVGGIAPRAEQYANAPLWEFPLQPVNQRERRIFAVAHAKDQFVLGIILAAEAGKILIGVRIESVNGLNITDRGE